MKISLITISPDGCIWRTMRDGKIAEGRIHSDVPRDKNGDYIYDGSQMRDGAASYGRPFSDLPVFFDATPKLEKFFTALTLQEFSRRWLGIVLKRPAIAVHLVGYSRMIHLGEQLTLKDCILRWGSNDAIVCKWPTPYSDAQIREILLGEVFQKKPKKTTAIMLGVKRWWWLLLMPFGTWFFNNLQGQSRGWSGLLWGFAGGFLGFAIIVTISAARARGRSESTTDR